MFAKILIAAFCLAAVVTAAPAEQLADSDFEALWQTFVSDHGKTYHPEEVLMRFRVFKDNVNFIMDHNANKAEELGYTVGINQFADMTNAEFKRLYTGYNAPLLKSQENVEILPAATADSVDWTTKNAVTPVKVTNCLSFSTFVHRLDHTVGTDPSNRPGVLSYFVTLTAAVPCRTRRSAGPAGLSPPPAPSRASTPSPPASSSPSPRRSSCSAPAPTATRAATVA